jgi:hypothetical protein
LTPRDYFVVAVQYAMEECRPPRTGSTENVIGLVRVLTRDGRVAALEPLPSRVG